MRVEDVMTRDVTVVSPETPLKEAARLLAVNRFSGLPVVDAEGTVIGVLSEADILVKEGGRHDEHHGLLHWLLEPADPGFEAKLEATTAGDAMSAPPVTITARRPLREAANQMLEEGVNRLPVIDERGALVGLVTRGDLVRAFVRSDEAIAHEIETDVVKRIMWVEQPDTIKVTVNGGMVTLEGEMENESDVTLLPRFVERVPGVVAVDSKLTVRR
jgi:CBS-domain-containing membrane protein